MPVFQYEALDSSRRSVAGALEAENVQDLSKQLQLTGLFLVSAGPEKNGTPVRGKRASRTDLAIATRHLAILLQAGFPLRQALGFVVEQFREKPLGGVMTRVRERLTEGMSFHQALRQQAGEFDPLYVNMVYAGETAGSLDSVLLRLADFIEKQLNMRNRLQVILTYPVIMVVVGTGILIFLLAYVVPIVSQIFANMEQSLPVPTMLLLAMSGVVKKSWLVLVAMLAGGVAAVQWYRKTEQGAFRFDQITLRIPVFSGFYMRSMLTNFSRTLATLLGGGVEIVKALDILKESAGNAVVAQAIYDLRAGLTRGEKLSTSLTKTRVFPATFTRMIAAGEQSGQLEQILEKSAEIYENELSVAMNRFVALLEPGVILVMGVMVGFIVLAILLPIFEMSQFVG